MDTKHNDDTLKTKREPLKERDGQPPSTPQPKKQSIINKIEIPISSEITGRTYHLEIQETKKGFYLVINNVWTPYIDLYKSQ